MQLWDFACAGADVSDAYLERHSEKENPLVNQTQQYLAYAEPVLGPDMDKSEALVAIWIGVNDVVDTLQSLSDSLDYKTFWNDIIGAIFAGAVEPMRAAGYANFVLVNLPPLDRTSSNQESVLPRPSARLVAIWNAALANHTCDYAGAHPDVTALLYDANTFLNGVMDSPGDYNITNTDSYCDSYDEPDVLDDPEKYGCEPLNQYFWHNGWHL
jgi:phospholipase/lecithinase/hemolysin